MKFSWNQTPLRILLRVNIFSAIGTDRIHILSLPALLRSYYCDWRSPPFPLVTGLKLSSCVNTYAELLIHLGSHNEFPYAAIWRLWIVFYCLFYFPWGGNRIQTFVLSHKGRTYNWINHESSEMIWKIIQRCGGGGRGEIGIRLRRSLPLSCAQHSEKLHLKNSEAIAFWKKKKTVPMKTAQTDYLE